MYYILYLWACEQHDTTPRRNMFKFENFTVNIFVFVHLHYKTRYSILQSFLISTKLLLSSFSSSSLRLHDQIMAKFFINYMYNKALFSSCLYFTLLISLNLTAVYSRWLIFFKILWRTKHYKLGFIIHMDSVLASFHEGNLHEKPSLFFTQTLMP